jgi:acyl-CoA thioester hydrolase
MRTAVVPLLGVLTIVSTRIFLGSTVDTKAKHFLLADFPIVVKIPVQWGDQDAFGHVNNTVPHRWFESARIELFGRIGLLELKALERIGPILAATSCDYRRQINFPDTVHVGIRVARIGRTSIALEHAIVSEAQQAVVTEGTSTTVVFDYEARKPHPVPESVRQAVASLEGRPVD